MKSPLKRDIDIKETISSIGVDDISPLTETEKSAKVSDLLKARSGVYLPAAYETPSMKEGHPFRMSARDLACFGQLFLNEGRRIKNHIVPTAWVHTSAQPW